jgi:hypothetical protein
MVNVSSADSSFKQRQRRRFPSGIPNAGDYRRREMLNGSVSIRCTPDMRDYLEARRAMRESAAEPNKTD